MTLKTKRITVWALTIIISLIYIIFGNKLAAQDRTFINSANGVVAEKAKVVSIEKEYSREYSLDGINKITTSSYVFNCIFKDGPKKGEEVLVSQVNDAFTPINERPVKAGDNIYIFNYPNPELNTEYSFGGYIRINGVIVLGLIFFALLIIFGGIKGLNTVISLAFTILAVFFVYIPSVLNGFNIYINTFITCTFITIVTLLLNTGLKKKTLATILGCAFGVLMAAGLSLAFDSILQLTGILDQHSIYLTFISTERPVNLNAIIFGMIVIGSLGAVMDVAMNIASSLYELRLHVEDIQFKALLKSGINIGRDIMGTMSNTLVLAYIGSSLCTILLLITYVTSLTELFNREMIVVELLKAFIGSTAILLTIPLTSLVCGVMYPLRDKNLELAKERMKAKHETEQFKSYIERNENIITETQKEHPNRQTTIKY